jgi:carbonic anhydrase
VNVHGWVYGLHNGLLKDLAVTAGAVDEVNQTYDRALGALLERYLQA